MTTKHPWRRRATAELFELLPRDLQQQLIEKYAKKIADGFIQHMPGHTPRLSPKHRKHPKRRALRK
jgi:hypothetical protein